MEKLFQRFQTKVNVVSERLIRYIYHDIDWNERLIAIKGSRGVGKTTLIFQYIKRECKLDGSTLYVSLDDIHFQFNTLTDLADDFYANGGRNLFLDEVHKYENWSLEIKNIYDTYSDLKIVFTSSSLLEIYKGSADLSRRAVSYELKGLSFREFLLFEYNLSFNKVTLNDILTNHLEISTEIIKGISIIPMFKKYLAYGYYPFYKEGENAYYQKLNNVINLSLEVDVPTVFNTDYKTIHKLKKLLYVIATSVPYQPNVTKLAEKIETTSRSSTLQYLNYLERAELISNLKTSAKGNNILTKPDKIYLQNTNLIYCLALQDRNDGNIRETFFNNQLSVKHKVNTSKESDFLIDKKYTFEIGGKHKKSTQIKTLENAFIAADGIELGFAKKIPLWLFGMMY